LRTPPVSEEVRALYVRAGRITKEAREFGVEHAKAGTSALQLADSIEALIRSRGARPAFPVNIGINQVAAHYTPSRDDDVVLALGDVVKIDVGAHVDGYPADTSATVEVGTRNHTDLIRCASDALDMVIEMVAPGTTVAAMGEAAQRAIASAGFRPIENLTGHSMERYNLHAGMSIPSIPTKDRDTVKEGMILAIEPFSTTGSGKVVGRERGNIYRIVRERKATPEVATMFSSIVREYGTFPFASRWCEALQADSGTVMNRMTRLGMIMNYPILTEVRSAVVAQSEHSVLVTSDGCTVLT
jgi:methionyl aminopeptidase